MEKKGYLWLMVLGVFFCLTFNFTMLYAKTYTAKFPHKLPTNHPRAIYIQKFVDEVSRLTKGNLKIKVYPGGQLYQTKQGLEAMALGDVQIMNPPNGHLVAYSKAFELLEIPFLMKDAKEFRSLLDSKVGDNILNTLKKRGLLGLAYWDEGDFVVLSKKKLLNKPENFKGLKIRTSGHPLAEQAFRAFGASTVKMSFSEVYTAAQQGVIDGIYTTLSSVPTAKLHEVAPYVTTFPSRGAYICVVNKEWYEKLPKEYQKIIKDTFKKIGKEYEEFEQKNAKKFIEQIEVGGGEFHRLTPDEIAVMEKIAGKVVIQKARKDVGDKLVDELLDFLGKK